MEITVADIVKTIALVNLIPVLVGLVLVIAPFVANTHFAVTIGGFRYLHTSDGMLVQRTETAEVTWRVWFPWNALKL